MTVARDFSTRAPGPREPRLTRVLFGAAVLALAYSAWSAGRAWSDHREASRAVEEVRRERDEARGRLGALGTGPQGRGSPVLSRAVLTLDAAPPRIVAALARVLPPGVRIDSLAARYGEEVRIDLSVAARDAASYDAFLQQLERDPRFRDVLPGEERRGAGVQATVRATWAADAR